MVGQLGASWLYVNILSDEVLSAVLHITAFDIQTDFGALVKGTVCNI